MTRKTRVRGAVACCALAAALLAGCGRGVPGKAASDRGGGSGASAAAPAQHLDISVAIWDAEKSVREGQTDAIYDTICKALNISLVPMNVTYDDYLQKIQVWAASAQLPDVFAIDAALNQPFYKTWIKEGIVKPLPNDLAPYPNLKKILDGPDYQAYKWRADGLFYCIPRPTYSSAKMWANEKALLVRKDWMASRGYTEDPDSLEQMVAMLKDLSRNNPEGKSNVVGVTAYDRTFIYWFMIPYNPLHALGGDLWMKQDGKFMPAMLSSQTMEGLRAMKKMWDAGVIDRDIATISGQEGLDKFASGRSAALVYGGVPSMMEIIAQKFEKSYPDRKFKDCVKLVHPWKSSDGTYWYFEMPSPWSESYINGKTDSAKLDRILRLYDYLLSDEGLTLLRFGIKDVDYKKQGDTIVSLRTKRDDKGALVPLSDDYPFVDHAMNFLATWDQDFDYINPNIDEYIRAEANRMLHWYWENAKGCGVLTDFRADFLDYPSKSRRVAKFEDEAIKAIMSPDMEKTWQNSMKRFMNNGYDAVIKEFNEAAKAEGMLP